MAKGTGGFEAPAEENLDRAGNINPPPGHISLETIVDPERGQHLHVWLIARIADEGARTVSGYARHSRIQRRRRRDLTDYQGTDVLAVEVPLVLGSYAAGKSIEDDIKLLELMAGLESIKDPPRVRVDGPVPHARGHDWHVEEPEWGEAIWRKDNHRVQAAVTITLVEPIDTTLHRIKGTNPFTTQPMLAGWNLYNFAQKRLGDRRRWKDVVADITAEVTEQEREVLLRDLYGRNAADEPDGDDAWLVDELQRGRALTMPRERLATCFLDWRGHAHDTIRSCSSQQALSDDKVAETFPFSISETRRMLRRGIEDCLALLEACDAILARLGEPLPVLGFDLDEM